MMKSEHTQLQYKPLWLCIGFLLIGFVVYQSIRFDAVKVDVAYFDKFAHVLAYFLLMGWFVQIYQSARTKVLLALLFIGLGIVIEFVQGAGGIRFFEVEDMLANMGGVVCALLLSNSPFASLLLQLEKHFLSK